MKNNVEQESNHVDNNWDTLYQFLRNTEKFSITDSVMLLELMDDIKNRERKFFEVKHPYYALISAKNMEEAVQLYIAEVAGSMEESSEIAEETKEVSRDYALILYSRIPGEDGKLVSIKDVIQNMKSDSRRVVLMDGSLV